MPVPEQTFPGSTPSRVRVVSSTLVKPLYDAGAGGPPPATDLRVRLSQFDKITYDTHIAVIYGFSPPVAVSTADIAFGLARALAHYRDWAGRLAFDVDVEDEPFVLLNDGGARFVEASSDAAFDRAALTKPSPALLALHPPIHPVGPELVQVQLTRFACGTLTVGFTAHHLVADGHAASNFLVAWGRATRGLPIGHPQVIYNRAALFPPRRPPRVEFEHRGAEFAARKMFGASKEDPRKDCVVVHRTHFGKQFLAGLKAKASATASGGDSRRRFTTFECLVAHLWRVTTRARGLDPRTTTEVRISVDGRARLRPPVPDEYFGNLVLWALPRSPAGDVSHRPLGHAATIVSDAISRVADDRYFRSFIDFASSPAVRAEDLETTADAVECVMSPHLEVHSWLRFPFHDVDFGAGHPFCFMPTYSPAEGMIVLLPSVAGDSAAGIEVYVALFDHNLPAFNQLCYQLD
ncbi:agmatine coumaroyltransferase-2-like [Zingiber officinale]|uniref:agmatine coumaroyltransferase-2-like n=1 Tax=Zingiber officinale TaxID=94328 RepID=UPI001C4C213F|nr:agmatine coumaroyltransferase-2-like [Zingiber officinale]